MSALPAELCCAAGPAGVDQVFLRGGYLHPLYTPAGLLVSGDYPSSIPSYSTDFWNDFVTPPEARVLEAAAVP